MELFQIVFLPIFRQVGPTQIPLKRNHWVFNVWPRCWPLVSWKTYPNIWAIWLLEVSIILERPSFWLGCKLVRRRLLVLRILVALQWHPLWITLHGSQNRLSHCHLGIQPRLGVSEISVLTPLSWDDSSLTSLLLFTLVICQAGSFSIFLPFFLHSIQDYHCLEHRSKLELNELNPLPAMRSSWSLGRALLKRFLLDSWASTMHACFDFRLSDPSHVSLYCWFFTLQDMAASMGNSNFSARFKWFLWTQYHSDQ